MLLICDPVQQRSILIVGLGYSEIMNKIDVRVKISVRVLFRQTLDEWMGPKVHIDFMLFVSGGVYFVSGVYFRIIIFYHP